MIRLDQWSTLVKNRTYGHTETVHVTVKPTPFLLLHFRSYDYKAVNIQLIKHIRKMHNPLKNLEST